MSITFGDALRGFKPRERTSRIKVLAALVELGASSRERAVPAAEVQRVLQLHLGKKGTPANVHAALTQAVPDVERVRLPDGKLGWRIAAGGLERLGLSAATTRAAPSEEPKVKKQSSVFIVHGHDEGAKEGTARFVEKLGLSAVILHEQPNRGKTIIEKLEYHSRTDAAIVLLTPDDEGRKRGDSNWNPRARQNVVLELGLFVGVLGRDRVIALRRGDLEVPSDYHGVIYIELDPAGGWRAKLQDELKAMNLI